MHSMVKRGRVLETEIKSAESKQKEVEEFSKSVEEFKVN